MERNTSTLLLALFVIALALQTVTAQATRIIGPYTRIFEGIEYASGSDDYPRLQQARAIRVSLKNPNVALAVSHDNGGLPYETTRQTPQDFLVDHALKVAVNASFFDINLSPNTDDWGLVISNGVLVSPPQAGVFSGQLNFTADKIGSMVWGTTTPPGLLNAVACAERLLQAGAIVVGSGNQPDPHTAIGLSRTGHYMVIVTVDGRRDGWSNGCYYNEMAQWMLDFGAWDAGMFDGGGSTCLVRDDGAGNPQILNWPCETRPVGVNLGATSVPSNTQGPNGCAMNSDRVDICFRGNMNHVYMRTWTRTGGWQDPVDMGFVTTEQPTIISRADGKLQLFACGTDGQLYKNAYSTGAWSGWGSLGGALTSAPAACAQDADHMSVVVRGTGNTINYISWTNGPGWSTWSSLAGSASSAPAICSRDANKLEVFYRGTDNQLYHKYNNDGGGWSAWSSLGGTLQTSPTACARDADHMEVFAGRSDGQLQHIYFIAGTGWSTWSSFGGTEASRPGAACPGGDIHLFYRGPDDHLWKKALTAGVGWSDWMDQGPYF